MAKISSKAQAMPASAIRKLVPLADAAKANGTKVYHLNVGQPDIKSPQCALEAVRNNTLDHVSYTNSAGMIELRQGLVEKYYKKIGIELTVPEILVTVAGSEAVDVALQVTCDAGDELIVMEPYYTNYNTFCFMNGITLKAVHTDIREGFSVPDMARFEELITPRTKAILISNPGNPTGTLYTKEQMLALGEIARKHDLFLISDEVYREFCYTDEPHFSAMNIPGLEQNVILIDSVSKRYNLCGCRVGCIASHNMLSGTPTAQRTIHITGERGEITGKVDDSRFTIRLLDPHSTDEYREEIVDLNVLSGDTSGISGGHAGGDERLVDDFVSVLLGETPSISCTSIMDSVAGHMTVFCADRAMETGAVVDIPPLESL